MQLEVTTNIVEKVVDSLGSETLLNSYLKAVDTNEDFKTENVITEKFLIKYEELGTFGLNISDIMNEIPWISFIHIFCYKNGSLPTANPTLIKFNLLLSNNYGDFPLGSMSQFQIVNFSPNLLLGDITISFSDLEQLVEGESCILIALLGFNISEIPS